MNQQLVLDQLQWIDDWRCIHEQGQDHGQGLADVAVIHVDGGTYEGNGERRENGVADDDGYPENVGRGHHAIPDHQCCEDGEADAEFNQFCEYRGEREDFARKVDLLDQCSVADHTADSFRG